MLQNKQACLHAATFKAVERTDSDMPGELAEKVIVVTGGGNGIGAECAMAYAREGASVAILDRDLQSAQSLAKRVGERCIALSGDVADGCSVEVAIAQVLKRFGRIDAVHNNAGIATPSLPLHETSEADWDRLQSVNVKSVYWTTRFAFSALAESKGSILNTASMVGLIGQPNHAAYVASKGAMISLTKAMAVDYAPFSIRVNAVCPAGVRTPTLERWCAEQPNPQETQRSLDQIHPLGPCPQGDVVADVAVFLLSHRARFMAGCIVPVSGGAELGYRR
jgi:meso-butanediol dehydrogenase/(S,S)-butanediol dehydrogenase/diacetyl reductase